MLLFVLGDFYEFAMRTKNTILHVDRSFSDIFCIFYFDKLFVAWEILNLNFLNFSRQISRVY